MRPRRAAIEVRRIPSLSREPRSTRVQFVAAALCAAGALCAVAALAGCGRSVAPGPALASAPELPLLPAVGGVQDLWPFEFGFDAGRSVVRSTLGEPSDTEERQVPDTPDAAAVVWRYPGLELIFYHDTGQSLEYLLSVRVSDSGIRLGAGVSVGMTQTEVTAIMGEPALQDEGLLAYFYLTGTIEFVVTDGAVVAVVLTRAMP